jgi:uncharacterized protein (TIGR02246 family)
MSAQTELAEIEAIKQLKARYFRGLDTKDWPAWRKVFTDDLEVIVDRAVSTGGKDGLPSPHPRGGDAFVVEIAGFFTELSTVHHGHMPEITLTGPDTAVGIWSMEDIVGLPDGQTLRGYGHYHEQYRKVDGAWRIARLHLTRLRLDYTAA